jgi:hypothetical protein
MRCIDKMIARWNEGDVPVEDRLTEALFRLEKMHAERLKLDRRIHNQRRSCRDTWEIFEMRRKWIGSDTARKMYGSLLKRYRALQQSTQPS